MPARYDPAPPEPPAAGEGDIVWDDLIRFAEAPDIVLPVEDRYQLADSVTERLLLPDTAAFADTYQATSTLTATKPDTARYSEDEFRLDVVARTWADNWTDEDAPNVNHGTDPLLNIQQGVLGVTPDHRAYVLFDLTKLVGFEAIPGNDNIVVRVVLNPPLVNVIADLTVASLRQTSQPWTELGGNANNTPNHPTAEGTVNLPLISGGFVLNHTLATKVGAALGNYLSVEFSFQALVAVVGIFTIESKEAGDPAVRPRISFSARHAAV